jgi:hypothetical protein
VVVSKAALSLGGLATGDGPLGMIEIQTNGAVVSSNGRVVAAIGPENAEVIRAVPLEEKGLLTRSIVLSADTAKDLAKKLPRDIMFKGLLEHYSINDTLNAVSTDGRKKMTVVLRRAAEKWVEWKSIFQRSFRAKVLGRAMVNRKALEQLVDVLRGTCPYSGDFAGVLLEWREGGILTIRCVNEMTGQPVIITFAAQVSNEMLLSTWERSIINSAVVKK